MDHSALAFIANDDVIAITCTFQSGGKRYTYKTLDDTLKPGDLVLVECSGPSNYYGFCVVKVKEVDTDVDLQASFGYKWIVGKIDLDTHTKIIKAEKQMVKEVRRADLKQKRQTFAKAIGIDVDFSLTKFLESQEDAKE